MLYMISPTSDDMMHYGVDHLHSKTGRGSGRYAWGSGKNPRAGRQIYGNSNGVTKQTIKKRNKDSGNKSGVDVQVATFQKNIATNNGTSKRDKFMTKDNVKVVNEIAKDNVNCALCTYAMDLRERKIDVRANSRQDWISKGTGRDTTVRDIATWYKTKGGNPVEFAEVPSIWNPDYSIDPHNRFKDSGILEKNLKVGSDRKRRDTTIQKMITSEGNGTYGHLTLNWIITDKNNPYYSYTVGGHDVFYKVENGKVMIYDGQSGKIMPYDQYMVQGSSDGIIGYPDGYLRTDNLELSKNSVSKDTVVETNTPDKYNYSPSNKTVTKIKSITQYSPPYTSTNKEVIQYTPPYKTNVAKKAIDNGVNKVKNVSVNTGSAINKVWNKVKSAANAISNNTSPSALLKKFKIK